MSKMVIEVPDQFVEVGKAMAEHLALLQRTVYRLGGGKAVDYAAVEAAMAEGPSMTRPVFKKKRPNQPVGQKVIGTSPL